MSHFSVCVITDEFTSVRDVLERFNENLECEEYVSRTKEELIDEAKEMKLRFSNNKDQENASYAIPFINAETDEELYEAIANYYAEATFSDNGDILSTYNADAKYDWYQIGGRWSGFLKAKQGICGERSWCNKDIPLKQNHFDSARIKDIDFSIDKNAYDKEYRFYEVVVDKSPLKTGESKKDFATHINPDWLKKTYGSAERYAKVQTYFHTWAVVTEDGEWHECGHMGWFGTSDATGDDEVSFVLSFKEKFIDTANPESFITIVDCHI